MKVCSSCQRCYDDPSAACSEADHPALSEKRPGTCEMIAGYRLEFLLDSGGSCETYHASVRTGQTCFINILPAGDEALAEFQSESEKAAKFFHPNVAEVYETGTLADGDAYVVTEKPGGQTLRELLNNVGVPSLLTSIQVARQAAEALYAMHENGLLHRAVYPENIILTSDAEQRLLVKIQNADLGAARARSIVANKFLTASELNALKYFAPELSAGDAASAQSDVYGLGVVFYEMLAGIPPFDAPTAAGLIDLHKNHQPPEVRIDKFDLRMLITHTLKESLQKQPHLRHPTANALARQLRHIEQLATHISTPPPAGAVLSASTKPVTSPERVAAAIVPARTAAAEVPGTIKTKIDMPVAVSVEPAPAAVMTRPEPIAAEPRPQPEPVKVEPVPEPVKVEPAAIKAEPAPVRVRVEPKTEPEPVRVEPKTEPVRVAAPEPEPVIVAPEPAPVIAAPEPEPVFVALELEPVEVEAPPEPILVEPEPVGEYVGPGPVVVNEEPPVLVQTDECKPVLVPEIPAELPVISELLPKQVPVRATAEISVAPVREVSMPLRRIPRNWPLAEEPKRVEAAAAPKISAVKTEPMKVEWMQAADDIPSEAEAQETLAREFETPAREELTAAYDDPIELPLVAVTVDADRAEVDYALVVEEKTEKRRPAAAATGGTFFSEYEGRSPARVNLDYRAFVAGGCFIVLAAVFLAGSAVLSESVGTDGSLGALSAKAPAAKEPAPSARPAEIAAVPQETSSQEQESYVPAEDLRPEQLRPLTEGEAETRSPVSARTRNTTARIPKTEPKPPPAAPKTAAPAAKVERMPEIRSTIVISPGNSRLQPRIQLVPKSPEPKSNAPLTRPRIVGNPKPQGF